MSRVVKLTQEGYAALERERDHLEGVLRPKNNERIKHARRFCDFSEDSEYEAALKEQDSINKRIKELNYLLRHAKIIDPSKQKERVTLGTTVEIIESGREVSETFTIVSKEEAQPSEGEISVQSPLGKALLQAKVGDCLEITTPDGILSIKVKSIQ